MVRKSRASRNLRAIRGGGKLYQPEWAPLQYRIAPTEILNQDQLQSIHRAGLKILSEIGVRVLSDKARAAYADGGFEVDNNNEMVRFDPQGVEQWVAKAPSEFSLTARNPQRNLRVGDKNAIFASVGGPAYCMDNTGGRRTGTYAEMCDFLRLVQSLNIIHQEGGGGFEALDLPATSRHLDLFYAQITLTDKNWQPWTMGEAQSMDALNMAAIMLQKNARGPDRNPGVCLHHQHQFTAAARHTDGGRTDDDGALRPGGGNHAFHPEWRDVTDYNSWRAGSTACRGNGRHRTESNCAPRCPGYIWWFHFECRHAHRLARVWHARVPAGGSGYGPVGASDRCTISLQQRHLGQYQRCAGGV